eukprot:1618680-Pleurochrysis_carterae.AAC.1
MPAHEKHEEHEQEQEVAETRPAPPKRAPAAAKKRAPRGAPDPAISPGGKRQRKKQPADEAEPIPKGKANLKANQRRIGTQYKTVGPSVDLLWSAMFGGEEGKFSPEAIHAGGAGRGA